MSAAIPELRKTKGHVVFTSSGAANYGIAAWGCYGSSKAAMNHLTLQLSAEEPDITFVAISPGKVDTDMHKQIREAGKEHMAEAVHASFVDEHESGKLLKPEQPGTVIANLVVDAPKEFSGKHFRYVATTCMERNKSANSGVIDGTRPRWPSTSSSFANACTKELPRCMLDIWY